jgi:outer membrane protein insertion porin family
MRLLRGALPAALILIGLSVVTSTLGSVSFVAVANAQSASNIVVEGNRRVEAETVRSYFRRNGGGLGPAQIDDALKALYETGLFQDVKINQSGGRIIVTVVENPVINRVVFEGNRKVKDEQLSAEVQSKPRGTLSRPVVQSDTQRITEIYRRSGRFDVSVTPKIIDQPNNRVDLVFEVNEGAKTGVNSIEFTGNKVYSGTRLKDVIKTRESNILSFLGNGDIYDPDRVESDRDLIRRFYLKNGFADVRVIAALTEYDPGKKGFIVTFTIDEGAQYRVESVDVESAIPSLGADALRSYSRVSRGSVYNAEAVEKSIEEMTIQASRLGYPFATVRPRGDRNRDTQTVSLVFVVEDGPRTYIERINVRGNNRTRDYVIRREFDIAEGDAYNRALVDRAERRLKGLDYFKTVKITNEPGSSPDRIVLNVDVEEKSTGDFAIQGGYSTSDGLLGEVSVSERNLMGRGLYAKATVSWGTRSSGYSLSFADPYFLGYRIAWGVDLYQREQKAANTLSYDTKTLGGGTRLGFALREDLTMQLRYSLYRQEVTLPYALNNCIFYPPPALLPGTTTNCYGDGEASLPIRMALANGPVWTSMAGYSLIYNTLDNSRNPSSGLLAEFRQDFAGLGGDVNYIKSTFDAKYYTPLVSDIVALLRVQGGNITGWGSKDLRVLDHFQMGPNLVRGFAPNGIGPRDLTPGTFNDALGGTNYWGATAELQMPFWFMPKEVGLKGAVYVDAGSLWDYKGPTGWPVTGESISNNIGDSNQVRSSVGAGIIWQSPFGPLRVDVAVPLSKASYDRTQIFRFGGGTSF